uniref:Uncharacterized protein n=1 Tax=Sorghum bicolor TaxID=4558 RepID=C6JSD6_SORBI
MEGYDYGNGQGGQYFGNQDGANDAGDVGTDGGAREGDEDDFDNLEDMIRAIGPEILLRNKGVENVERVKKASMETVYSVEKGCPTHWTLLRFVLELLILKAKYGWSDSSFNDLLGLVSWVLPQPNLVPTNTYHAKKVGGDLPRNRVLIGLREGAGTQGRRAGALPLAPFDLRLLPVASRVF